MRRGLSTLVLLVVALALGAYIYFVESKRKPASERQEEKAKVFTNLETPKIEELQVKASGGDVTTLKKSNDQWTVTAPVAAKADQSEVSSITSNLSTLEIQRVVDEKPSELAQYGLAPAKTEITVRAAGDPKPRHLMLGSKTPTGGDLYAKLADDPKVFLVSGFLDTTFNKSTFDLRDKSVLQFDRDKVTTIEMTSPNRKVSFAKEGDAWRLTAPIDARADFGTVEGLVGRFETGQMKTLVADAATDLKQYGLDPPQKTISILAGSARSSLLFGNNSTEGQVYAKDAARPMVFTVESFLADDFNKQPDDFRLKDVYEFRTYTGNRFEITRNGSTAVFEKKKGKDANAPERWTRTQPPGSVDSTKIDDFLSKISNLRVQSFVGALPAGAAEAARTSAKWNDGKRDETVTFVKSGEDVFAVRPGEPGAAKLTPADFNDAMKALDAIK